MSTDTRRTLERTIGEPFVDSNQVHVFQNGDEIFPAMLAAINQASESVDMLSYIAWDGELADRFITALVDRANRGLRVRVMFDAFGSESLSDSHLEALRAAGAEARLFEPFSGLRFWRWDKRTHRKILVCDGLTAFTGGAGLADEWLGNGQHPGSWREAQLRVIGPVVAMLQGSFLESWNTMAAPGDGDLRTTPIPESPGNTPVQVVRSQPTPGPTRTATMFEALVAVAQNEVMVMTPYFFPHESLRQRLVEAAQRGVSITILTPDRHADRRLTLIAGRRHWGALLDAGVRILRYQETMLHAKQLIVDGRFTAIGSANMNHRSTLKDQECTLIVDSTDLAREILGHMKKDLSLGDPVTIEQWRTRPLRSRLAEWLLQPFREQL